MGQVIKDLDINNGGEILAEGLVASDFLRFAEAKGLDGPCNVCTSSEGWTLYVPTDGTLNVPNRVGNQVLPTDHSVQILGMRCRSCGLLRLFDLEFMQEWIRENEAETNNG